MEKRGNLFYVLTEHDTSGFAGESGRMVGTPQPMPGNFSAQASIRMMHTMARAADLRLEIGGGEGKA